MSVIYSIGAKFAGGGIGTTAFHAVRGLHRNNLLQRLLCSAFRATEIPRDKIRAFGLPSRALRKLAVYDRSRRVEHFHNRLFDAWVANRLEQANLFHVWGNYGAKSLQRAKALGMTTVVERASCHPAFQAHILKTEYVRWGQQFLIPQAAVRRAVDEMHLADYVLIPSNFVRLTFIEQGFPEGKLIEVPFGVDTNKFQPAEKKSTPRFRVLFVGRVGIHKGILYLLEAWRQLRWQDAELWIVGQMTADSVNAFNAYRTLANVRWVGYVEDPVSLYQQSDLFVFPSLQEGSALVTYEALSCGLPVITTPNAGSIVRDRSEGFIVPVQDADALASKMEQVRADKHLRESMRKAARARAEHYTWERYGDTLAKTYRELS